MSRTTTAGRGRAVALLVAVVAVLLAGTPDVKAEPIDTWDLLNPGVDCLNDVFNPTRADGTKDPNGDPLPGTPEWIERDRQRLACDNQRDSDRRGQPAYISAHNVATYGEDWYRQPYLFDDVRFRFDYLPTGTGPGGVPAMEIYRPCSASTCGAELPEGLQRHEPPYPVVVVHHGFIATMTHHRYNAQVFAEAGYLAVVVNGTHPVPGAPNVQRNVNGGLVLDWLAADDLSGEIGDDADLTRVAMAGHSQGSAAALSYQGDPRVDTILAWDGGDAIADVNTSQPIMYQRTDGAFSASQSTARTDYPEGRDRGLETYTTHKERGLDVMHLTFRATNHIDWNGNGVGSLAGNRWAELAINYYSLAWLDRHLQGLLVTDDSGAVLTSGGRSEAEERAYRQSRAQDAFDRLTALAFDDSVDPHQISMGLWDPELAVSSADPLYGGNIPFKADGLWITDRLAQEYRSFCSVSVPDYVNGGGTAARADSGANGDMRFTGCTVAAQPETCRQPGRSVAPAACKAKKPAG